MALLLGASTSDVINHGQNTGIDDLDPFTWIGWFNINTFTDGRKIITKDQNRKVFQISGTDGDMAVVVARATTNAQYVVSGTPLTLNTPQLIALVYDSGAGANEVINIYTGTLAVSASEVSYGSIEDGDGATLDDNFLDLHVGNDSGAILALQGDISHFSVFNRAFSLNEVISWQWRPRVSSGCGLFSIYGFNAAGTQPDWSGSNNPGTVTGATVTNHVPLGPPFGFDEPSSAGVGRDLIEESLLHTFAITRAANY